jgi:hypothetical protein
MTSPDFPANIEVVETPSGVLYRMNYSYGYPGLASFSLLAVAVPASLGVLGTLFLAWFFPGIPGWQMVLSVPFCLQMFYLAYLAMK